MDVVATDVGFYGGLRCIGERFEIADEKDLGSWMEKVGESKPKQEKAKPGQKPAAKPEEKPEDNLPDA
ncbi:hypothetical protein [Stutzerimonas nitrititolerans]|uniref:hypothetical protein n=1 Tax=Stutzerimonas nitrititolerans TaxID=2482751 RepID=UPI002898019C|nr:hypothetical protein [Stutzerimonas nitrititolerans]